MLYGRLILMLFAILWLTTQLTSQSLTGTWVTVNEEDQPESHISLYIENGKLYGKIIKILNPDRVNARCDKCEGDRKGKSILNMVVIEGMVKNGNKWEGDIVDPKNGKVYSCYIELENQDRLKVRGFIGFSLLGRTQYWRRLK